MFSSMTKGEMGDSFTEASAEIIAEIAATANSSENMSVLRVVAKDPFSKPNNGTKDSAC